MLKKLIHSETVASILDQAVVSGGNFLTTLVLARVLIPADYGIFSLLFLSLFAINTCHSSLVVYPLTLKGAADPADLSRLTCAALLHTLLLAAPLSLILLVITIFLHHVYLWPVLVVAMIAWQLQETVRRALLSVLRFRSAIMPDILCYVGQGLVFAILRPHNLSTIFSIVAGTSFIAALWQFILTDAWSARHSPALLTFVKSHGVYSWWMGRFVLAGNALNMIALQIPAWTLAFAFDATRVANYQSLLNLVGISNPVIFSINSLLIPTVAREAVHGYRRARKIALDYGFRYGVLLLPAFTAMMLVPHAIMKLVYGGASPYTLLSPLLRIFVAAFALQYIATVVGAYEGGMSRPKTYMWVQVMGTGLLLTVGVAMIFRFGVTGAVSAMFVASAARLVTFLVLAHQADKQATVADIYITDTHLGEYQ
ncbi:MATE family efflux transporter [Granulicella arctica]|uniref:hypothetical protein n=1 Tax=Granulicella arctica TaxID=940613 RepID=UPI0021E001AE|nr:hypothetical protein [Granulicella arctica]